MENPIKTDDLGVPLFLETPICSWESWAHPSIIDTNRPTCQETPLQFFETRVQTDTDTDAQRIFGLDSV